MGGPNSYAMGRRLAFGGHSHHCAPQRRGQLVNTYLLKRMNRIFVEGADILVETKT